MLREKIKKNGGNPPVLGLNLVEGCLSSEPLQMPGSWPLGHQAQKNLMSGRSSVDLCLFLIALPRKALTVEPLGCCWCNGLQAGLAG